ncbi:hypothetical protein DYB32_001047 [Aphanomyces invadans]|uniref:DUF4472 domain-containing protein n=1 Tax=Aphanomyces invadans TaxID=157072 RepID=A0A418B801_9STRA|nr:hypothetical protein DYB32_001047 [Aphanomyces invadans]
MALVQKTHDLEGKLMQDSIEKSKLKDVIDAHVKSLAEYRTKVAGLVEIEVGLRKQLLDREREKLSLSKALVDCQLEHSTVLEALEKDKFDVTTKLLNAENDLLELQMREEHHDTQLRAAQDAATAAVADKKELAIEFVALKANFVAVNKSLQAQSAKAQQLSVELLTLVNQKAKLAALKSILLDVEAHQVQFEKTAQQQAQAQHAQVLAFKQEAEEEMARRQTCSDLPEDLDAWSREAAAESHASDVERRRVAAKVDACTQELRLQVEKNLQAAETFKGILSGKERDLAAVRSQLDAALAARDQLQQQNDRLVQDKSNDKTKDEMKRMQDVLVAQLQELKMQLQPLKQDGKATPTGMDDAHELRAQVRKLEDKLRSAQTTHMQAVEATERRCAELTTKAIMLEEEVLGLKNLLKTTTKKHRERVLELTRE